MATKVASSAHAARTRSNESHLLVRMNFIHTSPWEPSQAGLHTVFWLARSLAHALALPSSESQNSFETVQFLFVYDVHVLPGGHRPVLSPHDFISTFLQYICEEPGLGRQFEAVEDHGGHNGVG